tara:strand:+ start:598 stop:2265 length:1668 start_codon:yes stop_codon:yes gene_type:complete
MDRIFNGSDLNQKTIFDHPSGLFVLFFTEMWERFSYYGMRAILVLFLTSSIMNEGWAWEREDALILYGWYTGLVYFTPLIGGVVADKYLGYRNATVLGALIMALGHGSLALEGIEQNFFYLGLALLIIGNGLFKPNISSIVGQLYKDNDPRKDGAYTIFYMGINAGAFLGILLCGYLGENIGWHWGFGLAGIFMFFGMLQFYFAQSIFGYVGLKPEKKDEKSSVNKTNKKITSIEWDRIHVILVFSAATIFFWWAFEQAGGSMTIFANDYTERNLTGESSLIFKTVNTIITIIPMIIITYVLIRLFKNIFQKYMLSNIFLGTSFVIIWAIVLFMLGFIPQNLIEYYTSNPKNHWAVPVYEKSYYFEFFKNYVPFELNANSVSDTEIPASWFSVLNSLFIILLAPVFSKIWASKYNPSGPIKFSIGLILLGLGFAFLSYGSMSIPFGAKTASVSIFWLVFAYLFHTLGELCVSPVGLSYVSKLAPVRLIGLMFGFWLLSSFFANLLGGFTGSFIDKVSASSGLSGFFLIFTIIPIVAGIIMFLLDGFLKKKMHGIK